MLSRPMPRVFFARDASKVAHDLIGKHIVHGGVVLRITETEAYGGATDSASHCRFGPTQRNAPMWGPPGHLYVYLCYGIHRMMNIVTGCDGEGQAVLVRSAEVVRGLPTVLRRRGGQRRALLVAGPGKVAAALALDVTDSGKDICTPSFIYIEDGAPAAVQAGFRVGVDFATAVDRRRPWRFVDAASSEVSHQRALYG